jgi:two-component system response regulator MprA
METVLIVDDDERLCKMLQRTLVYEGFDVVTAENGQQALEQVYARHPDVVVLDWMMPALNGLDVLEALRADQNETPVLMLTARDAIEDRVEGLENGADDYLVKPFAPAELVARVRALMRRAGTSRQETLSFADLHLDPRSHEAWRGAPGDPDCEAAQPEASQSGSEQPESARRESARREFTLTPTEYELLRLFMRHPGQVLTKSQILANVWGPDDAREDNVLEVYVGYVRKKTEAGGEPRLIQTIRGVGYVLREEA